MWPFRVQVWPFFRAEPAGRRLEGRHNSGLEANSGPKKATEGVDGDSPGSAISCYLYREDFPKE